MIKQRKTGKVILFSTIGLASYCGFLIANIPAESLWHSLPTGHLPVKLSGLTGTPWSGAAESVTLTMAGRPLALPAVRWQMEPASLLKGELNLAVELGNPWSAISPAISPTIKGKGIIAISRQMLTLTNVSLDTSAQWLMAATGGQVSGELTGNVFLELDRLKLNDKGCLNINGHAELTDSQLASPFGQVDLGNAKAELSCQQQHLVARVTQKSSFIHSNGDFQIGSHGRYTFTGTMTPDLSLPDTMKQEFTLLGRPDSSGAYPLSFRGSIIPVPGSQGFDW